MDLGEFLYREKKRTGLTIGQFADELGLNRTYMNGIISGRVVPSYRTALMIERYTEGAVTTKDILGRRADRNEYEFKRKELLGK